MATIPIRCFSSCFLLIVSIAGIAKAQDDLDKCVQGDGAACERYSKHAVGTCPTSPNVLGCLAKSQCYANRGLKLQNNLPNPDSPTDCDKFESAPPLPIKEIQVGWFPFPQYPLLPPAELLLGGRDIDQNDDLYVCRVHLLNNAGQNLGVYPGKLLKGSCNVAAVGIGGQYSIFEFAFVPRKPGHWAPPSGDQADMLEGGVDGQGKPVYVCRVNYTEHEGFINLGPVQIGSKDIEHGTHVGQLGGGSCWFEFGGKAIPWTDKLEVYYLTPPPPPPPTVIKPGPGPGMPGYCCVTVVSNPAESLTAKCNTPPAMDLVNTSNKSASVRVQVVVNNKNYAVWTYQIGENGRKFMGCSGDANAGLHTQYLIMSTTWN